MRMKHIFKMMIVIGSAAAIAGACSNPGQKEQDSFKYTIDSFADLKVMRYQIPGWENLTLRQKEYAFHLSEAAKYGRDILWDQNCKDNLRVRHALEAIRTRFSLPAQGSISPPFLKKPELMILSSLTSSMTLQSIPRGVLRNLPET